MIHLVGNMVEIPNEEACCTHQRTDNIIFVGRMSYEPNVIAVTYFVTHIFPMLKQSHPNLNFLIIGSNPIPKVKDLEKVKGVKVTGYVDSIEPYLQNAMLVVAPMWTGAGIQNKIIQAMAYGCCVVTTPIGAEGLFINNKEAYIYDSTEKWLEGLEMLIGDNLERKAAGKRARNYVIEHLSEKIIKKEFFRFIKEIN